MCSRCDKNFLQLYELVSHELVHDKLLSKSSNVENKGPKNILKSTPQRDETTILQELKFEPANEEVTQSEDQSTFRCIIKTEMQQCFE